MNKSKVIIGIIISIVVIYFLGVFTFSQRILPNTTLSGHQVEMINKSSLDKEVKQIFGSQQIEITDDVITNYSVKLTDLGATIDADSLAEDLTANQNAWKWPVNLFTDQDYDLTKYIEVDEGQLNGKLVTDKLLTKEGRTKSSNAKTYFAKKDGIYKIKEEVYGNIINAKFNEALIEAIKNGDEKFDATKYYKKPSVVSDDLKDDVELLNSRIKRDMTIVFGDQEVEVPKADIASFIFIDDEGKIDVDNTTLYNYIYNLSLEYDNVKKVNGKRVVTTYNADDAYYKIENELLADGTGAITAKTGVDTFNQAAGQTSVPTSSTYIEVSISQQYMWLYNDGELVIGTPVVTGNVAEGWDTPTGTFSVWNKETNKVLNGATVGYDYEVPVDYWMAIDYTGVGIHDIDWLTSSNANASRSVYKTDGSHGCINTPDDLMATVYNNTPLGTPVYVMP